MDERVCFLQNYVFIWSNNCIIHIIKRFLLKNKCLKCKGCTIGRHTRSIFSNKIHKRDLNFGNYINIKEHNIKNIDINGFKSFFPSKLCIHILNYHIFLCNITKLKKNNVQYWIAKPWAVHRTIQPALHWVASQISYDSLCDARGCVSLTALLLSHLNSSVI